MAEREGFEPSKRFPVYTLSKRAPSTWPYVTIDWCALIFRYFIKFDLATTMRSQKHLNFFIGFFVYAFQKVIP